MNQLIHNPQLNVPNLSKTLLTLSSVELIFSAVVSVLDFLLFAIVGASVADTMNSVGSFFIYFFIGLVSAALIFFAGFVISVLLRAAASVVLNTSISAMNSEKIAQNTAQHPHV